VIFLLLQIEPYPAVQQLSGVCSNWVEYEEQTAHTEDQQCARKLTSDGLQSPSLDGNCSSSPMVLNRLLNLQQKGLPAADILVRLNKVARRNTILGFQRFNQE
jgi:hypothetical protein